MSHDPAAFHRALLAGSRPLRREWHPVPVAAAAVLCGDAVLGTGWPREAVGWVVLTLLGGVALLLLGLRRVPERPALRRDLGPLGTPLAAAAILLGRVLLIAACASLAATLVGLVAPVPTGGVPVVAVLLLAVVGAARLVRWGWARGRVLAVAEWCGVLALAATVVAGALVVGTHPREPLPRTVLTGQDVLAVLAAGALGGLLIRPALEGTRRGSEQQAGQRVLGAVAGVLGLLAVAAAGAGGTSDAARGLTRVVAAAGPVPGAVLAVLLAVVVLVGAATALSAPPLRWRSGGRAAQLGRPADEAGTVAVTLSAAVAVWLAAGDVPVLVACYAVTVLLLAVLALGTGRRLWRRALDAMYQPAARRRAWQGRTVTGVGTVVASVLLLLAAVRGWAVVPALLLLSAMMWGVSRHDRELDARLVPEGEDRALPTVVRAFVVAASLDRPALRAVTYARALRATSLEVLTVPPDDRAAATVRDQWAAAELPVPLVELAAPPGEAATAVVEHVAAALRAEPSGLAVVYVPEVWAKWWWRRLLVGRESRRLRRRLVALPGTVVTTVPWTTEES
ncbi:hypothetical protein [Georgenia sp. H159]|uniref:hypothetical protein n=1 Tax=Georgenia sp. H159 TaxID=3076115 RepID=UPI002D765E45|nr:hypothetical protein [Georgenia sp. H159]